MYEKRGNLKKIVYHLEPIWTLVSNCLFIASQPPLPPKK